MNFIEEFLRNLRVEQISVRIGRLRSKLWNIFKSNEKSFQEMWSIK
jgi:hypothetical protein